MENSDVETGTQKKVGGWLLILCIALTILSPLRAIYELNTFINETYPYIDYVPGLSGYFYLHFALSIILLISSISVGVMLWAVKPYAVKVVKVYLILLLALNLISISFPFIFFEEEIANEALPEILKGGFQSFIFVGIWYPYLHFSKRVKETFGMKNELNRKEQIHEENLADMGLRTKIEDSVETNATIRPHEVTSIEDREEIKHTNQLLDEQAKIDYEKINDVDLLANELQLEFENEASNVLQNLIKEQKLRIKKFKKTGNTIEDARKLKQIKLRMDLLNRTQLIIAKNAKGKV